MLLVLFESQSARKVNVRILSAVNFLSDLVLFRTTKKILNTHLTKSIFYFGKFLRKRKVFSGVG